MPSLEHEERASGEKAEALDYSEIRDVFQFLMRVESEGMYS